MDTSSGWPMNLTDGTLDDEIRQVEQMYAELVGYVVLAYENMYILPNDMVDKRAEMGKLGRRLDALLNEAYRRAWRAVDNDE